jgi:C-terminal, D2-small domain, of ClpB protein
LSILFHLFALLRLRPSLVLEAAFLFVQGLDRQQIGTIVRLQAKRVADRLASRKIKLELDDSAVEWLADKVWLHSPTLTSPPGLSCCWATVASDFGVVVLLNVLAHSVH